MAVRARVAFQCVLSLLLAVSATGQTTAQSPILEIDAAAPSHAFPHFWEHMFGSGRAVLSLRESYREDLRAVRQVTAVSYVRFHGLLNDEMGVYTVGAHGEPNYNFSYIDQAYDGLLANGVRPIVELSFMPAKLAARPIHHSFWYRPITSPPMDYARWDALMTALAHHLIERYGIEEVSQWYFEVWNEPNLDFWAGDPKQATYWTLYDHTARSLKAVSTRLRVGGPATAQAAWVPAFLRHCSENHVPVDFVSTHVYGDDTAKDVFGTTERLTRRQMVCRAVQKVHTEIQASPLPSIPLIWTEFNASWSNHPEVTDAPFMGPWLAETIRQCDGFVQEMSYWTFSDVFEEQGVVKTPFYGGFGLIAAGGIPKPAFNAFALLHGLGEQRLANTAAGTLVTRRSDGTLVLALWNYAEARQQSPERKVTLRFSHSNARNVSVQSIDDEHGNVRPAYERMGAPRYPTQRELAQLREAAALPAAVIRPLQSGELELEIPSDGLVLVTVAAGS